MCKSICVGMQGEREVGLTKRTRDLCIKPLLFSLQGLEFQTEYGYILYQNSARHINLYGVTS